VLNKPN